MIVYWWLGIWAKISKILPKETKCIWSDPGQWINGPEGLLREQSVSMGFEFCSSKVCKSSDSIQECKIVVKSVAKLAEYREVVMFVTKPMGI